MRHIRLGELLAQANEAGVLGPSPTAAHLAIDLILDVELDLRLDRRLRATARRLFAGLPHPAVAAGLLALGAPLRP